MRSPLLNRRDLHSQTVPLPGKWSREMVRVRDIGRGKPGGSFTEHGKDWIRHQAFHDDTFSMVVLEGNHHQVESIGVTKLESYVKFNFWLSGRHTTIIEGLGQVDHDRPEVFITAGPHDLVKADILNRGTKTAVVALCILREFFPTHMGLSLDELPSLLRKLSSAEENPVTLMRIPFTTALVDASRSVLSAPAPIRQQPNYARAKAVELMCLLTDYLWAEERGDANSPRFKLRYREQLHGAQLLLIQRHAEQLTLDQVAKAVGLSRVSLTAGFRSMFGTSVHEFLLKIRMERARQLVQAGDLSIGQVAEAVGYRHACNFSTAFNKYFSCSPFKVRKGIATDTNREAEAITTQSFK